MREELQHLRVEEIGERAESGATEPYFCRLSDDQLYLAKGKSALARGLMAEVLCGALGRAFGLPIPDFALAEIDPGLLQMNPGARASLGADTLFASKHRDNLVQVSRDMLDAADPDLLHRLFLFDYWVKNGDRTGTIYGGNPNLFLDVGRDSLVVIDHNLAFDRSFDVEDHKRLHICRDFWFGLGRLRHDRAELLDDMSRAEAAIDGVEEVLPVEWMEADPAFIVEARQILEARHRQVFWDALR